MIWRRAGLIKGAQVIYLGPGRKPGFSRLHVMGAEDPQVSAAASIVKIEQARAMRSRLSPYAAKYGGHVPARGRGHNPQGARLAVGHEVQVFAPDIYAASRAWAGPRRGIPLWKRLAYVAITRAQERLIWVVRNRLSKPTYPLRVDDLRTIAAPSLTLEAEEI